MIDDLQQRRLARIVLASRLTRSFDLEDAVQETLVRLWRLGRRQKIRNVEATITLLAKRVAVDYNRRSGAETRKRNAMARERETLPDLDPGEDVALLVLSVLRYLEGESPECCKLLRRKLQGFKDGELASDLGISHAAVRQRISRCYARVRRAFGADPRLEEWRDE